jgi:Ca2+-binding EF-hand superfamily protein
MSVSEVIGMKEFVSGGALVAALFTAAAAIAQTAATPTSLPRTAHARRSFFTSDQPRADVPTRIAKMFNQLDLNRDGFITADELATSRAKFDERQAASAPKRAEKAFDRLDTNHDGQITQAELAARSTARKSSTGKHRAAGSSLLARADSNKDGMVTRAEYEAAAASGKIKSRHANMRGSALARLFDSADANKDGKLSLDEAQKAALQQFDSADVNHDGVLSPEERRQASKSAHSKRRVA